MEPPNNGHINWERDLCPLLGGSVKLWEVPLYMNWKSLNNYYSSIVQLSISTWPVRRCVFAGYVLQLSIAS